MGEEKGRIRTKKEPVHKPGGRENTGSVRSNELSSLTQVWERRWEGETADLLRGALQAGVVVDHSHNVGVTRCCL